ncbi:hypothetical protein TNCT_158301 [Trichonephila clavata]|uniref:Uncharacterized protein n=1 Tax=Trichonephila clavata TaxID=2740835 RepID=A0A8X6FA24_TRICU|nr:hypothetical protein TNCT_158301 [Trichonephila clavata]
MQSSLNLSCVIRQRIFHCRLSALIQIVKLFLEEKLASNLPRCLMSFVCCGRWLFVTSNGKLIMHLYRIERSVPHRWTSRSLIAAPETSVRVQDPVRLLIRIPKDG